MRPLPQRPSLDDGVGAEPVADAVGGAFGLCAPSGLRIQQIA